MVMQLVGTISIEYETCSYHVENNTSKFAPKRSAIAIYGGGYQSLTGYPLCFCFGLQ
jgi:hypothetical protein